MKWFTKDDVKENPDDWRSWSNLRKSNGSTLRQMGYVGTTRRKVSAWHEWAPKDRWPKADYYWVPMTFCKVCNADICRNNDNMIVPDVVMNHFEKNHPEHIAMAALRSE